MIWDKYSAAIMEVLAILDYREFYYYYVVVVDFLSYTVVEDVQVLKRGFEDLTQKVEAGIILYRAHTNLMNLNILTRLY